MKTKIIQRVFRQINFSGSSLRAIAKQSRIISHFLDCFAIARNDSSERIRKKIFDGVRARTFILTLFLLTVSDSIHGFEAKQFISDIRNRRPKPVQPIPEIKKCESFQYTAAHLRSPFEPFVTSVAIKPPSLPMNQASDINRPREPLEAYPLDSLKMVGTLTREDKIFALVKDKQGIIHRVNVGNYLGQNFGIIQQISESQIEVLEWAVTAAKKNYEERKVIIHLSQ